MRGKARAMVPLGTAVAVRGLGRWGTVRATVTGHAFGRIEVSFFTPDTGLPITMHVHARRVSPVGGRTSERGSSAA